MPTFRSRQARPHGTLPLLSLLLSAIAATGALHASAVDEAVYDMNWNGEGVPHGVPDSYNWKYKGRVNMWTPPSNAYGIIMWGQVYEDQGGNPATNTRVALRNHKLWVRYGNTWYVVQDVQGITGAAYPESFVGTNQGGDNRWEGSYNSVRAGCKASYSGCGYNYHYFPTWMASQTPSQIGVCAKSDFALIKHNASGTDDRASAKYLVSIGVDYYTSNNYGSWIGDTAIGRFKKVQTSWRSAYVHNKTEAEFRALPPPL